MKKESTLILLVEDNIDHAIIITESLKRSEGNFQVDVAGNSDECLEKLREDGYDTILLDYSLPKVDGLTLLDKINEGHYQTPVIMVTGRGDENIAVEAMKKGAYDYVTKSKNYLVTLPLIIQKVIEKDAMAKENMKLEARLRQSEKMAAIGTLAAGVAHEFNNILAGMMGYAHLAQMDEKYVPKLVETVLTLCERGGQITQSLSVFSQKSQEDEEKYVDITTGLDNVIRMVEKEFDNLGIAIERSYKAIPKTSCNEGKLIQVFLNVLLNARDAIVREGKISVEADCVDNTICIKFTDTGCGIKEEDFDRIFEPFFTTKGSLGGGPIGSIGSGLGLSESYNIIEEHGGDIQVKSKVGIGTTFTVWLPVREEKDVEINSEKAIYSTGEGKRMLVVDDESHVRDVLKTALVQSGCDVVTANSGEAALAEFQAGKFDYIFLDLMMPGRFDGLAAFDEIKKVDAEANIIIITGKLLEDVPKKYLLNAYKILIKPFSVEQIYESIAE